MDAADGYDIFSPEYRADPWSQWAAMRRAGCPLSRSEAWGGSWMPVRYDDIHDIGRDAERFTSRATEVAGPVEVAGGLFLPPLTSDPPDHKPHPDLLLPSFTPNAPPHLHPFTPSLAARLPAAPPARAAGPAPAA